MKNIILLFVVLVVTACAANKPLYGWGSYQQSVYAQFNNDGPEEQLVRLEKDLVEMSKKGEKPGPGFYGHMGLLYAKSGQAERMKEYFDKEVEAFPESAHFISYLKQLNQVK